MTKNPEINLVIAAVPQTMIELIWLKIKDCIQRVVDVAHGDITLESIKEKLLSGNGMAVVISDGEEVIAVNILEVRVMESGLRCLYIPITGGGRLNEWMPRFLGVAKAIAKDLNCTELRGLAVRKGWLKVLKQHGWSEVHTTIKCEVE